MSQIRKKHSVFVISLLIGMIIPGISVHGTEKFKENIQELINNKQWQAATDSIEVARKEHPEDAELYYFSGQIHLARGNIKSAEAALKMALYFKMNFIEASYLMGILKLDAHLPGEAIFFLNEVVQADPQWKDAQYRLGEAYLKVSKYDAALDIFSNLIKNNATDFEAYYFVGRIRYEQNLLDGAVWNLNQCLAQKADYLPALQLLAQIHVDAQQTTEVVPFLEKILSIAPDSLKHKELLSQFFLDRAQNNLEEGQSENAAADYKKVLLLQPDNTEALAFLEMAAKKQNFHALLAQASEAMNNDSLQLAHELYSQAVSLGITQQQQDSIEAVRDSLIVLINSSGQDTSKTDSLTDIAEESGFPENNEATPGISQQINLKQFIPDAVKKNPTTLRYYLHALDNYNVENWNSALKAFDRLIDRSGKSPQILAQYNTLQEIAQTRNQQNIIQKALDLKNYETAKQLFQNIFNLPNANERLFETWFQIEQQAKQVQAQNFIRKWPFYLVILALICLALAWLISVKKFSAKIILRNWGLLILFTLPITALIFISLALSKMQSTATVEMDIKAQYLSFGIEENFDLNFSLSSDTLSLDAEKVNLNQFKMSNAYPDILREKDGQYSGAVDSLDDVFHLIVENQTDSLIRQDYKMTQATRMVLLPKTQYLQVAFIPQTKAVSEQSGRIHPINKLNIKLPGIERVVDDSTGEVLATRPKIVTGTGIEADGQLEFTSRNSGFILRQPASLNFDNIPIFDLSFIHELPTETGVETINDFNMAEIKMSLPNLPERIFKVRSRYITCPNRFFLQNIICEDGGLRLQLKAQVQHLQVWHNNNEREELVPTYLEWLWQSQAWKIIVVCVIIGILSLSGLLILIKSFESDTIASEVVREESLPQTKSGEKILRELQKRWALNLKEKLLPEWEKRISDLQKELQQEKDLTRKKELNLLLKDANSILAARRQELNNRQREDGK